MFCKNCGAQMEDNARFCSACGHEHSPESPENVKEPINLDPTFEEAKRRAANQILTWGIVSIAMVNTCWLALLGFIFSFVVKSKVKTYERFFGPVSHQAKVGRDLGKAGFIAGLILSILVTIYFFFIIVAAIAEIMLISQGI